MIEAVIFDLDGTMISSENASFLAWQDIARQLNRPFGDDEHLLINGIRVDEAIENLIKHWQLTLTPSQMYNKLEIAWQEVKHHIKVLPGVFQLHNAILAHKLPIACATASHRLYAEEMLNQFGLMKNCTAIACGDEAIHTKPAPDIFLLAAERLHISPQHCLAVEDSVPGHLSAAAAGMTVVVIPGPFNSPDDYPKANYIFPDLPAFNNHLSTIINTML